MKKWFVALLMGSLLFASGAFAQNYTLVKEIPAFASPESVIKNGNYIYVSNVGKKLEPSAKDGDGFISKLSQDGTVVEEKFLPKEGVLNAPKGMAIIANTLYVVDVDQLLGFDLKSGKKQFSMDFSKEKTLFLNDIAVKDAHTLFVSATDVHKIYEVTLGDKPSYRALDIAGIDGPNGLTYDAKKDALYVVGFGKDNQPTGKVVKIVHPSGKPSTGEVLHHSGYLDGVAMKDDHTLLFSDWVGFSGKQGKIYSFDISTGKQEELPLSAIGGPADFSYMADNHQLWIPKMMENTVAIYKEE